MIKLFTHTDLDGIGCAILAKKAYGTNNVDVQQCNYDEINEAVSEFIQNDHPEYDRVFITDISVNAEVAAKVLEYNFRKQNERPDWWKEHEAYIMLFDHHPTALALNEYNWASVIIDYDGVKTCGTEIFYNYLVLIGLITESEQTKAFVRHVCMYDTWTWEDAPDGMISRNVNDLYYMYGAEEFTKWALDRMDPHRTHAQFPELDLRDTIKLESKAAEIEAYVKKKSKSIIKATIAGHPCGIVYAEQFINDVGHELCKQNPDIEFMCMIDMSKGTISYRSIDNSKVDLGKDIAKLYGGGGHPCAAGSSIRGDFNSIVFKTIFGEHFS